MALLRSDYKGSAIKPTLPRTISLRSKVALPKRVASRRQRQGLP